MLSAEVQARVDKIPDRLVEVWDESDRTGDPESEVADRIEARILSSEAGFGRPDGSRLGCHKFPIDG